MFTVSCFVRPTFNVQVATLDIPDWWKASHVSMLWQERKKCSQKQNMNATIPLGDPAESEWANSRCHFTTRTYDTPLASFQKKSKMLGLASIWLQTTPALVAVFMAAVVAPFKCPLNKNARMAFERHICFALPRLTVVRYHEKRIALKATPWRRVRRFRSDFNCLGVITWAPSHLLKSKESYSIPASVLGVLLQGP